MSGQIAYLGPNGTFTEEALHLLYPYIRSHEDHSSFQFTPVETIQDGLTACWNKEVDYALVPMENSIEGSVNITLDWLIHQVDIPIQAEITLPVRQFGLIHPNQKDIPLGKIEKIRSHPHAIAQCYTYIRNHCPEAVLDYTKSTAEAAKSVAGHPDQKVMAIGTRLAADLHHLAVKVEGMEDHPNNFTRFVLVGSQPLPNARQLEEQRGKTSILVTLPEDFPGALHQVLAAFAWRKLNLTRIESRPTKKGLGSYFFFIDIEKRMDDVLLPGALSEIEALGCQIRFLGSYPCFLPEMMSKMPTQA